MFGLFKSNPVKKLEKQYAALMEKARDIQRSGDLRLYAEVIKEAEALEQKIDEARKKPV